MTTHTFTCSKDGIRIDDIFMKGVEKIEVTMTDDPNMTMTDDEKAIFAYISDQSDEYKADIARFSRESLGSEPPLASNSQPTYRQPIWPLWVVAAISALAFIASIIALVK